MMFFKATRSLSFFTLSAVLFYFSFCFNSFHAADKTWFDNFQYDSDSLIYGRVLESQKNGIFSNYGVLGRMGNDVDSIDKQKNLFLNKSIEDEKYYPYLSQVGLQGVFFSVLNSTLIKLNFEPKLRMEFFYSFSSVALSITLSLLCLYFLFEFGVASWICLLVTIISSQWLVVMGKSLYWSFWLMFVPLLLVLWAHKIEVIKGKFYTAFYFLLAFFVFVKCCAGYEYISSVLVSSVTPIVYYSLNNSWSRKAILSRLVKISASGLLGFILALMVHTIIVAKIKDFSLSGAFLDIFQHSTSRMYADSGTFSARGWEDGANASLIQVLDSYWRGEAINLNGLLGFNFFNSISFGELILLLLVFSSAALWSEKYSESISHHRKKIISFALMVWFSILSPLSWFVLAKVHSYVHTHINHVLWSMPFILLSMAFSGYIIKNLLVDVGRRFSLGNKLNYICALFFVLMVFLIFIVSRHDFYNDIGKIKSGVQISQSPAGGVEVYLAGDNSVGYVVHNCDAANLNDAFFLHFYPVTGDGINGLTDGFENHDFMWKSDSNSSVFYSRYVNTCYRIIKGPDFKVKKISTGQYNNVKRLWQSDYLTP